MPEDSLREVALRFFEASDTGNRSLFAEILHPDWIDHDPAFGPDTFEGRRPGVEGAGRFNAVYRRAFPDARREIINQVVQGDIVVTQFIASGTHLGDFYGRPPSGKPFKVQGAEVFRIRDGLIVERWRYGDGSTMYDQIKPDPA